MPPINIPAPTPVTNPPMNSGGRPVSGASDSPARLHHAGFPLQAGGAAGAASAVAAGAEDDRLAERRTGAFTGFAGSLTAARVLTVRVAGLTLSAALGFGAD